MKCYSIQHEQCGYRVAAHSLVNAIQVFCEYIDADFMELPSYGVNVSRTTVNESKRMQVPMSGERLYDVVNSAKEPKIICTYAPSILPRPDDE